MSFGSATHGANDGKQRKEDAVRCEKTTTTTLPLTRFLHHSAAGSSKGGIVHVTRSFPAIGEALVTELLPMPIADAVHESQGSAPFGEKVGGVAHLIEQSLEILRSFRLAERESSVALGGSGLVGVATVGIPHGGWIAKQSGKKQKKQCQHGGAC